MSDEILSRGGMEEGGESPVMTEEAAAPRSLDLPAEGDDEGWNKLYAELGRPDTPEGYALAEYLEGHDIDPQFAGVMGAAMHGAGLSKSQAQKIAAAYQEEWQSALAAANQAYESEKEEVMKNFAPGQIEAARRAFRLCGVSSDLALAIERSVGPRAAVEIFSRLGQALGEDRPARGAEGAGRASSYARWKLSRAAPSRAK